MKKFKRNKVFHFTEAYVICVRALSPPSSYLAFLLSLLLILWMLIFSHEIQKVSLIDLKLTSFLCSQNVGVYYLSIVMATY